MIIEFKHKGTTTAVVATKAPQVSINYLVDLVTKYNRAGLNQLTLPTMTP